MKHKNNYAGYKNTRANDTFFMAKKDWDKVDPDIRAIGDEKTGFKYLNSIDFNLHASIIKYVELKDLMEYFKKILSDMAMVTHETKQIDKLKAKHKKDYTDATQNYFDHKVLLIAEAKNIGLIEANDESIMIAGIIRDVKKLNSYQKQLLYKDWIEDILFEVILSKFIDDADQTSFKIFLDNKQWNKLIKKYGKINTPKK